MTVNRSLANGLENTLKLLSKASVARNTRGFSSVYLLQIYYVSSLTFYHDNGFILLLLMVSPFFKAVSKHLTGHRSCSHTGVAAPNRVTGSPLQCAGCQDKLRALWTRQRPFGANNRDCQMGMTFPMGHLLTSAPFTLVRILAKTL